MISIKLWQIQFQKLPEFFCHQSRIEKLYFVVWLPLWKSKLRKNMHVLGKIWDWNQRLDLSSKMSIHATAKSAIRHIFRLKTWNKSATRFCLSRNSRFCRPDACISKFSQWPANAISMNRKIEVYAGSDILFVPALFVMLLTANKTMPLQSNPYPVCTT